MNWCKEELDYTKEILLGTQKELARTQGILLSVQRPPFRRWLTDYRRDKYDHYYEWKSDLIDNLIGWAMKHQPLPDFPFVEPRVPCPLCYNTPQSTVPNIWHGFTLPEGLRRHFEGRGTHKCEVIAVASSLARAYYEKKEEQGLCQPILPR